MKALIQSHAAGGEDSRTGLNENHVRHVVTTFRYLDELLSKAEHIMASAGSPSPFQEYADDTTPLQRKVTHDYVVRLREMMSRNLEELRIPRPAPVTGALWAARNAVTFTNIALADLESKAIRGYGELSDAAAERIDTIVAELRATVGKLEDYLAHSDGADLPARLQRLEKTSAEVPLLRELERITTAHGLVEFRNVIAMLLERLENGAFEIGVFGRVSSGKSSLLNHLLGGDYLPVGVTPVTAVPTRIAFGPRPQVLVEFADSRPRVVELPALAEFATEQRNPGNAKHVARIRVEAPAAPLREGITFVDTPGLGSLATAGAEATVAYLPRCDLGMVLVDAASTLTHEDLKVVQAIYQAGATAMVLVSKADLLNAADRERTLNYVREQVRAEVNVEPPVHPVSVAGVEVKLCDAWYQSQLRPLLEAHRELARASLKRKVGGLREAVMRTLEARRQSPAADAAPACRARTVEAAGGLRQAEALLEAAERDARELVEQVSLLGPALIETTSAALAGAWQQPRTAPAETGAECAVALSRALSEHTARVVARLETLRRQLEATLAAAREAIEAGDGEPLPSLTGLPGLDLTVVTAKLDVQPPRFLVRSSLSRLRRSLRTQLQYQIGGSLPGLLRDYQRRLRTWLHETLTGLRFAFHAQAGPLRAQLEPRGSVAAPETAPASLEADLRRLQQWPG